MLIIGNFIGEKTLAWTSIHSWVTNSTTEELLYRLIFFASDTFWITKMYQDQPQRAHEIAGSKSVLSTICGHNVQLVEGSIDSTLFLHQHQNLNPLWRKTADAFKTINVGIKEYKYDPSMNVPSTDPHHRSGPNPVKILRDAKDIFIFEGHQLKRSYMPMPALAVLVPLFR